jgi:hypothetical protein
VGPGIKLKATEMKCHLQDFTWTYKMKYFPYFQGTGKANATTQSMTFDLHLALEGADNLTQAVLQAADTVQEEETHKVQALVSELAELPISEGLRLNIVTQRIHLTDLTMEVSESWFSHVYNVLVKVFTEQVVTALEAKLNAELVDKTDELLDLVNDLAQDYLPVLQEIQVKAGGSEQVMPAKRLSKTRMHANLTKALAESQDSKTATVVAADTFFDEDMD